MRVGGEHSAAGPASTDSTPIAAACGPGGPLSSGAAGEDRGDDAHETRGHPEREAEDPLTKLADVLVDTTEFPIHALESATHGLGEVVDPLVCPAARFHSRPRVPRRRSSATSCADALHHRLRPSRDPRRGVAEGAALAAVIRKLRALARTERQVDEAPLRVDQPPMALAPPFQLHRVQPGVVAAGEMEVGLRRDVGEAIEATEAAAVLVPGKLVGEDGLDLSLELVRGREADLGLPGARGGSALDAGGTHCPP